ncbi:hypothetical protein ACFP2T_25280 [Plantactinospora solaniradicis]|uniref:HAMP domain-containing protein n=1 Tax=Plantactinospora solaniradicis TaxID=1723736 RepID=A0ABW1KGM0_9ACTN
MWSTRLTIRARLTLVYGGLFLLAGLLLLGVTYALVSQQLPDHSSITVSGPDPAGGQQADPDAAGGQQTSSPTRSGDAEPPSLPENLQQVTRTAPDTRRDALDALLTQGGIALLVVGTAAVALGWLIAGRLLQPLHRVTETADASPVPRTPIVACTSGSRWLAHPTRSRNSPTPST